MFSGVLDWYIFWRVRCVEYTQAPLALVVCGGVWWRVFNHVATSGADGVPD